MNDETYDGVGRTNWLNGLKEMDAHNIRHLLTIFALLGIPESYMDVGCGTGAMVRLAQKLGVRAYGVDQLVEPDWGENFFHINLVNRFILPGPTVEIITCWEVAEHLHETAHATFCDTLCENLKNDPGSHLIFTAARPGQGGTGHLSMRPAEYWHQEFLMRGLKYDDFLTMNLAFLFSRIRSPLNYLYDNLMVFTR